MQLRVRKMRTTATLLVFLGLSGAACEQAEEPELSLQIRGGETEGAQPPDTATSPSKDIFVGCGDGVCQGEESPSNCCVDCACGPGFACFENQCKTSPGCGDGICQDGIGEHCDNCADCQCAEEQVCAFGGTCCEPACEHSSCGDDGCGGSCGSCTSPAECQLGQCAGGTYCGDGFCDSDEGEHCGNCPNECECPVGATCMGDTCCTPQCSGKHCGPDGCGGSCGDCSDGARCVEGLCPS